MRTFVFALTLMSAAGLVAADRHRLSSINTETPEGKLLQSIGQEADAAKKIELLQQFEKEHPKHDATSYVLFQMLQHYEKAAQPDNVIATGEKLLALDAEDIDAAYANLKASEAKKDMAGILKWSGVTNDIARKVISKQPPADDEDAKHAFDFAKQVIDRTEWSLYSASLASSDPQQVMMLADKLVERNPNSTYVAQMLGKYAWAMSQAKAFDRAIPFAEAAFTRDQVNEDMLLAMADYFMQQKKDPAKVLLYSNKIVEFLPAKPKPDGFADADWDKKKNTTLGLANWMAGVTYSSQSKFAQADKSLRAAMPHIKDNDQLTAIAAFHLGLVNYKMGQASKNKAQISEALKFSQQAAAIKSPLQTQAAANVKAMRSELGVK